MNKVVALTMLFNAGCMPVSDLEAREPTNNPKHSDQVLIQDDERLAPIGAYLDEDGNVVVVGEHNVEPLTDEEARELF